MVLSEGNVGSITKTTGVPGCTTDSSDGTLYSVTLLDTASIPTEDDIRLGLDGDLNAGIVTAPLDSPATSFNPLGTISGLTANTGYVTYFVQQTTGGSYSNVLAIGFETLANVLPAKPTITHDSPGVTTTQLNGTAFSDADVEDSHVSSQWQVTTAADTGYAAPVIDTGEDTVNLLTYNASGLIAETGYIARVRYKNTPTGQHSPYADGTAFTTAAAPAAGSNVRIISKGVFFN